MLEGLLCVYYKYSLRSDGRHSLERRYLSTYLYLPVQQRLAHVHLLAMAPSIWLFFFLSVVLTLPLFAFVPLGASQTRKVAPLCGIFDAFQQKISDAFANDMEYSEKDNPGRRLATISTEKSMRNARKISASDFIDSRWEVNITVKGIPRNDESSDLYAAKSVWGKQNGVAFSINFKALRDGVLDIEENDFTSSGVNGKWQLDEKDSTTLAFALPCDGFERSIKTVGTITNVMGGENTDRTTSFYFVPQGTCLIQSAIVMNTSGITL